MMHIKGAVIAGKQQARQIGYPTANLEYTSSPSPESGIWACRINGKGNGLAVVGMWQQTNKLPSLEIHILDFRGDLYGHELEVTLECKLRNLVSFVHVDDLVRQIEEDVKQTRAYFG